MCTKIGNSGGSMCVEKTIYQLMYVWVFSARLKIFSWFNDKARK